MESIDLIRLYFVSDGEVRNSVFTGKELVAAEPLRVDGYVCGVVALCKEDMDISIGGLRLNRIKENAGAGYDFEDSFAAGYSYLPKVTGDILSPDSEFDIVFAANGEECRVAVLHEGVCMVGVDGGTRAPEDAYAKFRYLGARLANLNGRAPDFGERLSAISRGVESVESAFDVELVDTINVVDCEYVDAFLNESLDELSAMAAHEALHILVHKISLTRDSEVRELFASLRGYDMFSRERFSIVTSGRVPPVESEQDLGNEAFFAFINEGNFFEGMNGGHSHRNLSEFCASLIHSLMLFDNFESNLERAMRFPGKSEEYRLLTSAEKDFIIESYLNAIDILIHALPTEDEKLVRTGSLLRESLGRAGRILRAMSQSA
jgi:hypothetical protein